jgi:glucose-6-phosphate dehydrogenase assembly protein OpcA
MVNIRAGRNLNVGRDLTIAEGKSQISQDTQIAQGGAKISSGPAPQRKESPIIRLILATLEIVKWWRGGKDDKPGPDQPL